MFHTTRSFLTALAASLALFVLVVLAGSLHHEQRAFAATTPSLALAVQPAGQVFAGQPLTYTLTITNADTTLTDLMLTQQVSPALDLQIVANDGGLDCGVLSCTLDTLAPDATVHITATAIVSYTVLPGTSITGTATLTATGLTEPLRADAPPVKVFGKLFLGLIRRSLPDPYAAWVKLPVPAAGAAVNFLFVSESGCATPAIPMEPLPRVIMAATNNGLYQLNQNGNGWEQRIGGGIEVSHIISTSVGYFAGSFNQGLKRSTDGGLNWTSETVPNNDTLIYWLAASGNRVLAAGSKGLYIKDGAGAWTADPAVKGAIFAVAAAGSSAYAVQIGTAKDTLFRSTSGGTPGSWAAVAQLPGSVNFVQMLDARSTATPELLIGTVGGGLYVLGGNNQLTPFSQGPSLTVYGIWRDGQGRVYAAFREPGGLQRYAATGGPGESLNALPGDAPATSERLYTVNGSTAPACSLIAAGSRSGNVWVRRIP